MNNIKHLYLTTRIPHTKREDRNQFKPKNHAKFMQHLIEEPWNDPTPLFIKEVESGWSTKNSFPILSERSLSSRFDKLSLRNDIYQDKEFIVKQELTMDDLLIPDSDVNMKHENVKLEENDDLIIHKPSTNEMDIDKLVIKEEPSFTPCINLDMDIEIPKLLGLSHPSMRLSEHFNSSVFGVTVQPKKKLESIKVKKEVLDPKDEAQEINETKPKKPKRKKKKKLRDYKSRPFFKVDLSFPWEIMVPDEERRKVILRWKKKKRRILQGRVKPKRYAVRRRVADNRIRIGGKFVSKSVQDSILKSQSKNKKL